MQFCTDLDNATCGVVANSMVNAIVTCTIKSFPPVYKGTYSCGNQIVDLSWNKTGRSDGSGIYEYQANASINSEDVPIFNGTCRLITTNFHGQFNETLNKG